MRESGSTKLHGHGALKASAYGALIMAGVAVYGGATVAEILTFSVGTGLIILSVLGLFGDNAPPEPPSDADRMGSVFGSIIRFVSRLRR